MRKISKVLFIAAAIFSSTTIILFGNAYGNSSNDSDDDSAFDDFKKFATERFEKKAYLCIQLEEYAEEDGGDEDLNYKEECDKILEDMDYFEKKEILKKYY